jgi:hypothetical protein
MRVCWPGVITRISVAPANTHELGVLPELLERSHGVALGDRNYCSPQRREELAKSMGVTLLAPYRPYRNNKRDPNPQRSAFVVHLSRLR